MADELFRTIPVTPRALGKVTLVDAEDYEWISKHKWQLSNINEGRLYASRLVKVNGRSCRVMLHRVIMDAPNGLMVDHVNRDGLDNRRCNLRICTNQQNQRNRQPGISKLGHSYKGVKRIKSTGKWIALIGVDYKRIHVGTFDNVHDAARAYNEAALRLFGEFARLNEIASSPTN